MDVLLQVQTVFVSNFDTTDVQAIDQSLNCLRIISGSSRQSKDPEMGIHSRYFTDSLIVSVIPGGTMRLVYSPAQSLELGNNVVVFTYHEKNDAADIATVRFDIIDQCLRGHEENSSVLPLETILNIFHQ